MRPVPASRSKRVPGFSLQPDSGLAGCEAARQVAPCGPLPALLSMLDPLLRPLWQAKGRRHACYDRRWVRRGCPALDPLVRLLYSTILCTARLRVAQSSPLRCDSIPLLCSIPLLLLAISRRFWEEPASSNAQPTVWPKNCNRYLDCGIGTNESAPANWCAPLKNWTTVSGCEPVDNAAIRGE